MLQIVSTWWTLLASPLGPPHPDSLARPEQAHNRNRGGPTFARGRLTAVRDEVFGRVPRDRRRGCKSGHAVERLAGLGCKLRGKGEKRGEEERRRSDDIDSEPGGGSGNELAIVRET